MNWALGGEVETVKVAEVKKDDAEVQASESVPTPTQSVQSSETSQSQNIDDLLSGLV